MKKQIALLLALMTALSLTACGSKTNDTETAKDPAEETTTQTPETPEEPEEPEVPEEPEEPEEPENPGEVDTSTWPSVSYGSVNSYVTRLQNRLNELGYDCGTADGDFGYNTRNAVIRFQKDHGLVVDGIVGRATWQALYA